VRTIDRDATDSQPSLGLQDKRGWYSSDSFEAKPAARSIEHVRDSAGNVIRSIVLEMGTLGSFHQRGDSLLGAALA
jgi:hypothetical protein